MSEAYISLAVEETSRMEVDGVDKESQDRARKQSTGTTDNNCQLKGNPTFLEMMCCRFVESVLKFIKLYLLKF